MEKVYDGIDALLGEGKRLSVEIERDIGTTDEIVPTLAEAIFRTRLKRAQKVLRERTKACLDYELAASDLLARSARKARASHAQIDWRQIADIDIPNLHAQRETLQRHLGVLGASVADIKDRCEARIANAINLMLLVLTISSIVIAVYSYRVARITYDVAKITYDDAAASGKEQQKSMGKEIERLDAANKTAVEQQGLLKDITQSAQYQANYLATEQLAERKQHQLEIRRSDAERLFGITQALLLYYQDLDKDIQNQIALNELMAKFLGVPSTSARAIMESTRNEVEERTRFAQRLAEWSQVMKGPGDEMATQMVQDAVADLENAGKGVPENIGTGKVTQTFGSLVAGLRTTRGKPQLLVMKNMVGGLSAFFDQESELYRSINNDYIETASTLAHVLVQKDFVDEQESLAPALEPFGITSHMPAGNTPAEFRMVATLRIDQAEKQQMLEFKLRTQAISRSIKSFQASLDAQQSFLSQVDESPIPGCHPQKTCEAGYPMQSSIAPTTQFSKIAK